MEQEEIIFKSLSITLGVSGAGYFIGDAHSKVYLTDGDIERISAAVRFRMIENLKTDESIKIMEVA